MRGRLLVASVCSVLVFMMAGSSARCAEDTKKVEARDGSVQLDDQMQDQNPEELPLGSVETKGADAAMYIIVTSKPFEPPPDGWYFKLFDKRPQDPRRTHVDFKANPDQFRLSFNMRRPVDTNTKLKVRDAYTACVHHAGSFPLKVEGNLAKPGPGVEPPHWAGKIKVAEVQIVEVPEYLYADATAAVPVKFKVKGLGSSVYIDDVEVRFTLKGSQLWEYDCSDKFAAGDGFGPVNNGTTDTYTAWVPISQFQYNIPEDTTEQVKFQVVVECHAYEEESVELESDPQTDDQPLIYGDVQCEVIELGVAEEWPVTKAATKQPRCHEQAETEFLHVSGLQGSVWPGYPHETGFGEKDGVGYWCAGPEFPVANSGFDSWGGTPTRTSTTRKIEAYLYDDWDVGDGGEGIQVNYFGEVIGTYFGVSYGLRLVQVLGASGMDLGQDSGYFAYELFTDGEVVYAIQGADVAEGLNIEKAAAGCATIAWALASTGWGVPAGLIVGAYIIIDAIDWTLPGRAHVACYTWVQQNIKNQPAIVSPRWPVKQWTDNGSGTLPLALSATGKGTGAGDTWFMLLSLEAACSAEAPYYFSKDVRAAIEYHTEKGFTANDAMKVSSASD